MSRVMFWCTVGMLCAISTNVTAQSTAPAAQQIASSVPLSQQAVGSLYKDKTWVWDSGAGYFNPTGQFVGYLHSEGTNYYAIGNWNTEPNGLLCFKAFWVSPGTSSLSSSCYSHRMSGKAILQKSQGRDWYVFKNETPDEFDEINKLKSGDQVTKKFIEARSSVTQEMKNAAGGIYEVKLGDTLVTIAEDVYQNKGRFIEIINASSLKAQSDATLNPLTDPNKLSAGDKIWLPLLDMGDNVVMAKSEIAEETTKTEGRSHIISPGETLGKISSRFLGSAKFIDEIVRATAEKAISDPTFSIISKPELITAGDKIWIPPIVN